MLRVIDDVWIGYRVVRAKICDNSSSDLFSIHSQFIIVLPSTSMNWNIYHPVLKASAQWDRDENGIYREAKPLKLSTERKMLFLICWAFIDDFQWNGCCNKPWDMSSQQFARNLKRTEAWSSWKAFKSPAQLSVLRLNGCASKHKITSIWGLTQLISHGKPSHKRTKSAIESTVPRKQSGPGNFQMCFLQSSPLLIHAAARQSTYSGPLYFHDGERSLNF
jgi:hypothetical protein